VARQRASARLSFLFSRPSRRPAHDEPADVVASLRRPGGTPTSLLVSARAGVAAAVHGPLRTVVAVVVHVRRFVRFRLRSLGRGPFAEEREAGVGVRQVFRGRRSLHG